MQIIYKPVKEIIPYANNPRINDDAVDKVVESVKEFGFRNPLILDSSGVIIAGHTRLKAAAKLGMTEVPCIMADDLTPEKVKAYRIADNKSAEYSKWDFEALAAELDDLQKAGYDLSLTAFGQDELDKILDSLEPEKPAEDDGFDENINPEEAAYTHSGDIWLMGNHRLFCADSTHEDDVAKLMDGKQADLALTDPPYNVDYEGKAAEKKTIQNDNMSEDDFYEFLLKAHKNMYSSLKDGAALYVFHADSEGLNFRRAFTDAGFKLAQCCVWEKNSMVLGRQDYQWQHEPVLYGWKPTGPHKWHSDRCQTTIWKFDRPPRSTEHPTMKPIPLVAYPIQNSSKKGDLILDLFGGSGSTLMACEQTGRICYMMEIEPLFCDVIVRRYFKATGDNKITLIRDGNTQDFNSFSKQFRF
ncbi:MAG TPA: DNA modification methylase [Caproiciproducens sp.]|nr:DNA modification methylase [Caproiciproducens sp.]